ncbi:MAG: D-2-hydroxyacid dehydrogenase [Planctomycetes bacterium]|nr:D-2-hydroxyacid dehydrogenase [Planctomycetota bacterium]
MLNRSRLLGLVAALVFAAGCAQPGTRPAEEMESLGSLRHATVAKDTDGGKTPVLYMAASLAAEDIAALKKSAPNLTVLVPSTDAEVLEFAARVHGMDGRYVDDEILAAAPNLVWVQSPSAGVDRMLNNQTLRQSENIVLSNMQGMHGPTIADHVFAMLLSLTRDVRYYVQPEQRGNWNRGGSGTQPIALRGRTLLVVGLGGIGNEVAKRGKGFGMQVWATRRSQIAAPWYVDRQETSDQLMALLPQADVVVLCVPLTDETRDLINADAFAAMKKHSYLINIARGKVVDTDALLAALDSGHLAGAGLDVTDPEPLPAGHALWQKKNVVITPHVAGSSGLTREQWTKLYVANLCRFAAGEPLLNVVDKAAGY